MTEILCSGPAPTAGTQKKTLLWATTPIKPFLLGDEKTISSGTELCQRIIAPDGVKWARKTLFKTITRGERGSRRAKGVKGHICTMMDGNYIFGGEHAVVYTDVKFILYTWNLYNYNVIKQCFLTHTQREKKCPGWFQEVLYYFSFLSALWERFSFFASSTTFGVTSTFNFSWSNRCVVISH